MLLKAASNGAFTTVPPTKLIGVDDALEAFRRVGESPYPAFWRVRAARRTEGTGVSGGHPPERRAILMYDHRARESELQSHA